MLKMRTMIKLQENTDYLVDVSNNKAIACNIMFRWSGSAWVPSFRRNWFSTWRTWCHCEVQLQLIPADQLECRAGHWRARHHLPVRYVKQLFLATREQVGYTNAESKDCNSCNISFGFKVQQWLADWLTSVACAMRMWVQSTIRVSRRRVRTTSLVFVFVLATDAAVLPDTKEFTARQVGQALTR